MVILPEVNMGGVYQLDTGSFYNIVELNSAIDYLKALLGRVALVPLTLKREAVEVTYQGRKRTHFLLKLRFDGDLAMVQRLREQARWIPSPRFALPEPVEDGPEPTGPPPVVEDQDDDEVERQRYQPEVPTPAGSDMPHLDTREVLPLPDNKAARQRGNDGTTESRASTSGAVGPPTPPAVWTELSAFLHQVGVVPDPQRAGDLIPYPEVAPGLEKWLKGEFRLSGGFEDLKAARPEMQAMVLLRMKAFKGFRSFLLKLGGGGKGDAAS